MFSPTNEKSIVCASAVNESTNADKNTMIPHKALYTGEPIHLEYDRTRIRLCFLLAAYSVKIQSSLFFPKC